MHGALDFMRGKVVDALVFYKRIRKICQLGFIGLAIVSFSIATYFSCQVGLNADVKLGFGNIEAALEEAKRSFDWFWISIGGLVAFVMTLRVSVLRRALIIGLVILLGIPLGWMIQGYVETECISASNYSMRR